MCMYVVMHSAQHCQYIKQQADRQAAVQTDSQPANQPAKWLLYEPIKDCSAVSAKARRSCHRLRRAFAEFSIILSFFGEQQFLLVVPLNRLDLLPSHGVRETAQRCRQVSACVSRICRFQNCTALPTAAESTERQYCSSGRAQICFCLLCFFYFISNHRIASYGLAITNVENSDACAPLRTRGGISSLPCRNKGVN